MWRFVLLSVPFLGSVVGAWSPTEEPTKYPTEPTPPVADLSTRHALKVPVAVPQSCKKVNTSHLVTSIEKNRQAVLKHPLYDAIRHTSQSTEAELKALIRTFMEYHVWAVWDYFQLLKRLQRELTCVEVPWTPKGDRQLRRFINEIVLEEESDLDENGAHCSHLELYIRAMHQSGANTEPIETFLHRLETGHSGPLPALAREVGAPQEAVDFVRGTLEIAMEGAVNEVAAVFSFGREDIIPAMFTNLLSGVANSTIFRYYLERHIELDSQDHGPLAIRLVESLCGVDEDKWQAATNAANAALAKRAALWGGVLNKWKTSRDGWSTVQRRGA